MKLSMPRFRLISPVRIAMAIVERLFRSRSTFWIAGLLATCAMLSSCSADKPSANSTPSANPELKAQVLQVIRENPQVILDTLQAYQQEQQQKVQQARQAFLQQMLTNPGSIIGNSPATGATDRKIVLLEFSDFQCPFCAKAHQTVKQFMDKHKDKVTLTYKHLPLSSIHPEALPAAKAAWAAQQQGKFWEYYDALFSQQDKLGEPLYGTIAQTLKLDIAKFNSDRNSNNAEVAIQKDIQMAENLGISGTPFFSLNGETLTGAVELSQFEEALDRVVKDAKR